MAWCNTVFQSLLWGKVGANLSRWKKRIICPVSGLCCAWWLTPHRPQWNWLDKRATRHSSQWCSWKKQGLELVYKATFHWPKRCACSECQGGKMCRSFKGLYCKCCTLPSCRESFFTKAKHVSLSATGNNEFSVGAAMIQPWKTVSADNQTYWPTLV